MEDFEVEPEERIYWCAVCKGQLTYQDKTDTIWRCDNCLSYYDTKIQDSPIKNNSEFKLRSHHNPYATFGDSDPNIVFVEGINPDQRDQQQEGIEVIRSSEDKRVQRLHVKGNLAKALSAMNEIDGR